MTTKSKKHVQGGKRSGELPQAWLEGEHKTPATVMMKGAQAGTSSSCRHGVWTEWFHCSRAGYGSSSPSLRAPERAVGTAHTAFLSDDGNAGLGTAFWKLFTLSGVSVCKGKCHHHEANYARYKKFDVRRCTWKKKYDGQSCFSANSCKTGDSPKSKRSASWWSFTSEWGSVRVKAKSCYS